VNTLGQELRRLREKADLSQSALGRLVDASPSTVNNIEAGRRGIPAARLYQFADALAVNVEELRPFVEAFVSNRPPNKKPTGKRKAKKAAAL